jgi:hypothetical protein
MTRVSHGQVMGHESVHKARERPHPSTQINQKIIFCENRQWPQWPVRMYGSRHYKILSFFHHRKNKLFVLITFESHNYETKQSTITRSW